MLVKKLGIRILFLAMLTGIILVPVVNSQEEENYSVPVEKAFEHANAHVIDFMSSGVPDFENWTGASIDPKPLELYDINGQKLFYEFSAYKNNTLVGKIYVGANKTLGPSVQVIETTPNSYSTTEAIKKSIEIAKKEYLDGEIKSTKVVEYSYPCIGAMTVVKDNTGEEHRIFVDVYSLDVVPDRPVTETELGVWSMYEQKLKKNGIDENLREWQKSDEFAKSIEKEAANKGICISVPIILDNYSNFESSNVYHSYYHYFFGTNSYGNTVITRYGKLPVLETEEQKENWNSALEKLGSEIKDTVASKYMYPHGEVMTCGVNAKGYFVILFKYGNVDEPLMNEIYALVDDSAKEMGIQDIPVEFGYGTYWEEISLEGINRWYWFGESTENLSESDINTLEEVMEHKPTMPLHKTIAAYGKIPLLKDQNEIYLWQEKLYAITAHIREKITPYIERGQIITYGARIRLEIEINETLSSEEENTIVKEVYQIIDEEARKQNVLDVPVIFMSTPEEENNGKLNNSTNSDSGKSSSSGEGKSSAVSYIPGFGLLGGLTCLYGGWKLRRK
jgi:hypothetical protein